MATLRRTLLRFHQTLSLIPHRSPNSLPRSSLAGLASRLYSDHASIDVDLSTEEAQRRLHHRLLYRSRQCGFLELDLVLGNWVEENIRSMDELRIQCCWLCCLTLLTFYAVIKDVTWLVYLLSFLGFVLLVAL